MPRIRWWPDAPAEGTGAGPRTTPRAPSRLALADPLARLTGLLSKVVKYWPSPNSFTDTSLKVNCKNYPKFPTKAFAELYRYSQQIARRLREVHVPARILQSKKDQIVAPEAANIIYEKVRSPIREIIWYEESGHEMMQDLEADAVVWETPISNRPPIKRPVMHNPVKKAKKDGRFWN